MSFPQASGQCPIYYNYYRTGRPHIENLRYVSRYQDIPTQSYYPFGYGLSYSKFEYKNLKLSSKKLTKNTSITASITIKNNSGISGKEVIQLYIQDLVASCVRPVKELKAFRKEEIGAFEEKEITFEITYNMLKFWKENLTYDAEEGDFKIFVGTNSQDTLEETFKML